MNFILTSQVLSALALKTFYFCLSIHMCARGLACVSSFHGLPHTLSVDAAGPCSSAWHVGTVI